MAESNGTPRICSVEGCGKRVFGRGWCSMHYARWIRHGDERTVLKRLSRPGEGMNWIKELIVDPGDDCIEWPFGRDGQGYGNVSWNNESYLAHRIAYGLFRGEMVESGVVCRHTCGNGHLGCVNPRHIILGTQQQNCQDTVMHGRCRLCKLTVDEVREIKVRLRRGETRASIASDFDVSDAAISNISTGKTWACVQ